MNWLVGLVTNPLLITSISSWLLAQILKVLIHAAVNKKFDIQRLFGDGGMPSGHSATVTSLAIMSALVYGTGSYQFASSTILAIIVCHDAMGVRRETGKQAAIINELLSAFEMLGSPNLPEVKLKEFVGHTPVQVLVGIIVGTITAVAMYNLIM